VHVESDQIHIVAMANGFVITVRVANLDVSETRLNFHDISPMDSALPTIPIVSLLYRPGHYDILYETKE
jgi:ubiquitin thioesterase protein OTUB1